LDQARFAKAQARSSLAETQYSIGSTQRHRITRILRFDQLPDGQVVTHLTPDFLVAGTAGGKPIGLGCRQRLCGSAYNE
jgi:hypothetical protein